MNTKKHNDVILYNRYWKSETVPNRMQQEETKEGKYVFSADKWSSASQTQSYLSRMTSARSKNNSQSSTPASRRFAHSLFDNSDEYDNQHWDIEGDEQIRTYLLFFPI